MMIAEMASVGLSAIIGLSPAGFGRGDLGTSSLGWGVASGGIVFGVTDDGANALGACANADITHTVIPTAANNDLFILVPFFRLLFGNPRDRSALPFGGSGLEQVSLFRSLRPGCASHRCYPAGSPLRNIL